MTLSNVTTLHAQDTIILEFGCIDGVPGDRVCIDLVSQQDMSYEILSFNINFDPAVVRFDTLIAFYEDLAPNVNYRQIGPADVRVISNIFNLDPKDVMAGTALLQVCFEVIGIPGDAGFVGLVDRPDFKNELTILPAGNTYELNGDAFLLESQSCDVDVIDDGNLGALITTCGPSVMGGLGTFTITGYGGQEPYTYTWSGGSNSLLMSGDMKSESLLPGTYTIVITDNLGTSVPFDNIVVPSETFLAGAELFSPISCYNLENGIIRVRSEIGASVTWTNVDNPWFSGSEFFFASDSIDINSLGPGNYDIVIQDGVGCSWETTMFLDNLPYIFDVEVIDSATCFGVADGAVSITVSGGRPNQFGQYSYTDGTTSRPITEGAPLELYQRSGGILDSIVVTTTTGTCDTVFYFTTPVSRATGLFPNPVVSSPNCPNQAGTVQLTPTPPGDYTFTWFDSLGMIIESSSSTTFAAPPGEYRLLMEDNLGVCVSDTNDVLIEPATSDLEIVSVTSTLSGCRPDKWGSATANVTGGTPGYAYRWVNAGGVIVGDEMTADGLASGQYTVYVTDNASCEDSSNVIIRQAQNPSIQGFAFSDVSCSNDPTVTIEVMYTLGDAPLESLIWVPGGDTTAILTNQQPGDTLSVLIYDTFFCFTIADTIVPGGAEISIDILVEPPLCGGGLGQLTAFSSGGLNPRYLWSNGDTNQVLAGVPAGTYSVTVTNADSCGMATASAVLTDGPTYGFDIVSLDSATCSERCDGAVLINATGGDPNLDYNFQWESGGNETGPSSGDVDLCAGWHTVVISQDAFCFTTDSIFIPAPAPLDIDTIGFNGSVSCYSDSDGFISLTGNGGNGQYDYTWATLPPGAMQNNLAPGTYYVTITDQELCMSSDSFNIVEPDSMSLSIDSSSFVSVNCQNPASGFVMLEVTGGNGGYSYQWSPDVGGSEIGANLTIGLYSITATDFVGCSDTTSFVMTGNEPVMGYVTDVSPPQCVGETTTISVDSVTGGSGGYTFSINGGFSVPVDSTLEVPVGVYNIIVQDSSDCSDTTRVIVTAPPQIELEIVPGEPIVDLGDSLQLVILTDGNQGPVDSVAWSMTGPLSCFDCIDPMTSNVVPVVYSATVWDSAGCNATKDVFVDVNNARKVYVPNVFSPNRDGRNDDFMVFTGQGILGIRTARVFNRWGELVVEHMNLAPNSDGIFIWDGTMKDEEMLPGVYVYVLEVLFADNPNTPLVFRGDITLLK